ncbi:uncharacterized protein LOC130101562 [Rhinichthys klamathensis goyatoka]|nr:uncharacterized protein LOC130101562 [Rhinichthys klamathensis goyatoka]
MLPTFTFICWWRDWITQTKISPRNVSCLKNLKGSDTVVFPRCVSKSENPEFGNHFILWVFCGQSHEIRVFDSMELYKDIPKSHMEILCDAFSNTWKLADWIISYPPQWLQSKGDANNCGVFVCTMAEMELKGFRLRKETIGLSQTQYLREYHATDLVKDVVVEESMKIPEKPMECMAGDLRVCCFQKVGKGPLYPSVVKTLWVQCDMCLGWLHTDCAGVKEADVKKGTFKCGCDLTQPYTFDDTRKALRLGIENIISDQDIKALHEAFHNGDIKSCRFYLWKHPETSLKFKQHLKPKQCHFSESDLIKLADKIKRAVDADEDLENLNYIFDVMIPEVTILLLQRLEKICRYAVEVVMASGIVKLQ